MVSNSSLILENASKTFSGVKVLKNVSLNLVPGKVHALLGHNGSGKSTLIKILAGVYEPDEGTTLTIRSNPVVPGSPADSYKHGLRFVHQRPTIINDLNAADNLALGAPYEMSYRGKINWKKQYENAQALLDQFGGKDSWDASEKLGEAPAIVRARFTISRALQDLEEGGVLVLDEPTASLAPSEVEELFKVIKEVTSKNIAVLYVTHRLREVYAIADEITVLRDGLKISSGTPSTLKIEQLISMLSGNDEEESAEKIPVLREEKTDSKSDISGEIALSVESLYSRNLNDISFDAKAGEILGIYGLTGSGRENLALALTGGMPSMVEAVKTTVGETNKLSVTEMSRLGVVLARESRAKGSLVDRMSIKENITLPIIKKLSNKFQKIKNSLDVRTAEDWVSKLDILPPEISTELKDMSGGNRQKVVIAKAMQQSPKVLVLDEPTAGVDVGAAKSLHALFRSLADEGFAVILVSSDIDEVCKLADQLLILHEGSVATKIHDRSQINENKILKAVA